MSDTPPKDLQPDTPPGPEPFGKAEDHAETPFNQPSAAFPQAPNDEPAPIRPRSENWIWGIVLIALGGVFLLQNLTPFRLINWWAIFILLPAASSFVAAWRKYQEAGRLTRGARGSLFGGLIFSMVAAIFLLNLDLSRFWPVFIIAAGLAIMVNTLLPD